MKKKTLYVYLIATALLCIIFWISKNSFSTIFTSALAFPFEQIAALLRALSISGSFLNALALLLYAGICLIPVWFMLWLKTRKKLYAEDWLLVLLSGLLFAVIYLMVNTGGISRIFNAGLNTFPEVQKAILGSVVWSVAIGYFILHVLRMCFETGTEKLQDYLKVFLYALAFIFILAAFGVSLGETIDSFKTLKAGNAGNESTLGMSYVFLVLRYIVNIAPFLLNIVTVFLGLNLLNYMKEDRYSEETVSSATKLSLWCKKTLFIVVVTNIAFNVLQLLFAGSLRNINSSVFIPVVSICFVVVVLIFARMITEGRKLKSDNDLFI